MSSTQMLTGNPLAVKLWATKGWLNLGQETFFGTAVDAGVVYFADELQGQSARGDALTYDYVGKLKGIPQGEGGVVDGNEEALDLGNFTIAMNVTRIGVLNPNRETIEQQRTLVNFEKKTRELIPARHGELIDTAFFYHAAGANPTSFTLDGTTWSGTNKLFPFAHNLPVAPSAGRIIRAGGAANDESITSNDKMTLGLIDYALEKANNSDQRFEAPAGGFMLVMSYEQATDLKSDTTGAIQWYNYQLALITGGKDNQFQKEAMKKGMTFLGTYAGVRMYATKRVAYGVNSSTSTVITTVRRAVLLGKDAVTFASPLGSKPEDSEVPMVFKTQMKDYDYYKGIEGRFIGGMKKTVASNSEDIGTMVIATYAAAHA